MGQPAFSFYPYQRRWIDDKSRFKVGMFTRQGGKSLSTSYEVAEDTMKAEERRKRTRWVVMSRGERQAKEVMEIWVKPFLKAFEAGFDHYDADWKGDSGVTYNIHEVVLPHGSRITAVPANPDTARGFSGNVWLDEFAIHPNSRAIWAALFPIVSANDYLLRLTSSPKGKGNKFYDIMTGGDKIWSRHTVDIYQAVADGLPRDIDLLRSALNDPDIWAQEYELQWLDEASAWLTYELINEAEDELAGRPEAYMGQPCYVGVDIAARNDLFVVWVLEDIGGVLWTREIITRRGITFAEQDAILDGIMDTYNVVRCSMDQTGMGEKPVEDAQARHGSARVGGVLFTAANKQHLATLGKEALQDHKVRIPRGDQALRDDLHKVRREIASSGAPRFIADRDSSGHADRFWAYCLALNAAAGDNEIFQFHTVPSLLGKVGDTIHRAVRCTAGFARGRF